MNSPNTELKTAKLANIYQFIIYEFTD